MRLRDLPFKKIFPCIIKKIYLNLNRPKKHQVSLKEIEYILIKNRIHAWFGTALETWHWRWQAYAPICWIIKNVSKDSSILETGCGCCWNSMYLAGKRFYNLSAFDLSENHIMAAREICCFYGYKIKTWVGDGLFPDLTIPKNMKFDVIMSLSWFYYLKQFDLKLYLKNHQPFLNEKGLFVFDFISDSYNNIPNNEYCTWTWESPSEKRLPSEYQQRHSKKEIYEAANSCGMQVIHFEQEIITATVPHFFVVLQKK